MREVLTKSLTVRGFINYEFAAEHYAAFLREVGAGVADGRIRYREDIVDGWRTRPRPSSGCCRAQLRQAVRARTRIDAGRRDTHMKIPQSVRELLPKAPLAHLTTLDSDGLLTGHRGVGGKENEEFVIGHLAAHKKVRNVQHDLESRVVPAWR